MLRQVFLCVDNRTLLKFSQNVAPGAAKNKCRIQKPTAQRPYNIHFIPLFTATYFTWGLFHWLPCLRGRESIVKGVGIFYYISFKIIFILHRVVLNFYLREVYKKYSMLADTLIRVLKMLAVCEIE